MRKLSILWALFLLGCGGGGGSSVSTPPPSGDGGGTQNRAPIASAGADATLEYSSTKYELDGSASRDPDGDSLKYQWTVSQQPRGSNLTISNANSVKANFTPSMAGNYEFTLKVTDPGSLSNSDSVKINFTAPVMKVFKLDKKFIDAEFDDVHDRVVTLYDDTLTLISKDGTQKTIKLSLPGQAVGVSPDGNFAVVGHIEKISYIDLTKASVISEFDVPVTGDAEFVVVQGDDLEFSDVILDSHGYVHLLLSAQNPPAISVNLKTGTTEISETITFQGSVGKLHSNGRTIYSLTGKKPYSTSEVERLVLLGTRLHNFTYDGDYNAIDLLVNNYVCNGIWTGFNDTALSGCHQLFSLSDSADKDGKFIMQLGPDHTVIQHASSSAYSRKWYVIDTGASDPRTNYGNDIIDVYDADSGATLDAIELRNSSNNSGTDWQAKFVFADGQSDRLHILAVDNLDAPSSYAMLVYPYDETSADENNQPPKAFAPRYLSATVNKQVTLDASASSDFEGSALTYEWALTYQPDGSSVSPTGLNRSIVNFNPSHKGVYEFELRVFDGSKYSALARSTVNVVGASDDRIYRLVDGVIDAEFSKPLNSIVYLSDEEYELVILDMDDLSSKRVALAERATNVSVSPDGLFAAVSHNNLASLVDISQAKLIDQQITNLHFGDIVLDKNMIAHFSPSWMLYTDSFYESVDAIYSVDFTNNTVSQGGLGYKSAFLSHHPIFEVMYGVWRGLAVEDLAKWDISESVASFIADSPYHGDYKMQWHLWISENGDKILTQSGAVFMADSDPSKDMTYIDTYPGLNLLRWADHSKEQKQWVATTKTLSIKGDDDDPTLDREYFILDDANYDVVRRIDIEDIPTSYGPAKAGGHEVFFSDDGSYIYLLLDSDELVDGSAVQIIKTQ